MKRPTPTRRNANDWVFANMGVNISKQVWEIGERYHKKFREEKARHQNTHPINLLRYWYFLYLTGSRLTEPLAIGPERPIIELLNEGGLPYVHVHKVNAKHMDANGKSRQMMDQAIPIFNEYERDMWSTITDGGLQTNIDEIFKFKEWKSLKHDNINCLIKTNFKTDLKDPSGNLHRNAGITPHILRHMRTFNVIVNEGLHEIQVVKMFGWTNSRMIYYYAHIRTVLEMRNQVEVLKRGGFLRNNPIDLGKAMSTY